MTANENSAHLRTQLLDLGQRFIGFDKLVEAEAYRAKKEESDRAGILYARIDEMEKLVYLEIKNRTEMNKQFQDQIELFCNTVIEKMQNRIARRIEKIINELDLMQTRLVTLERGQQQFRGELPSKLQVDTAALVKELQESKSRLEEEASLWRAREEAMLRKIDSAMKNVFFEIDKFSRFEDGMLKGLRGDMDKLRTRKDNKAEFVLKNISEIRQSVQIEEENRKFSDEEILNAIRSYTAVLQRGLQQVVNSR